MANQPQAIINLRGRLTAKKRPKPVGGDLFCNKITFKLVG